ncbi:hypothetical protein PUP75_11480 [Pseudomonas chlororaphis]|uniref:hypothetical protein n=1 Tax=Pseudomonas chlororaphis TaxID=587753 RepID=UPI002368E32A|nr:hypothetical protein [Pseudomonas chlororaphis]WDH55375.1 hypothetical protein PUP75_11480 [Pseudomonas chlororaphis]
MIKLKVAPPISCGVAYAEIMTVMEVMIILAARIPTPIEVAYTKTESKKRNERTMLFISNDFLEEPNKKPCML